MYQQFLFFSLNLNQWLYSLQKGINIYLFSFSMIHDRFIITLQNQLGLMSAYVYTWLSACVASCLLFSLFLCSLAHLYMMWLICHDFFFLLVKCFTGLLTVTVAPQ